MRLLLQYKDPKLIEWILFLVGEIKLETVDDNHA